MHAHVRVGDVGTGRYILVHEVHFNIRYIPRVFVHCMRCLYIDHVKRLWLSGM